MGRMGSLLCYILLRTSDKNILIFLYGFFDFFCRGACFFV